jgi:electron transfer flavoprotein beta subunit
VDATGKGMIIYVCVKHVPDTAARITILDKNRIDEKITFIMNPYDENAVEEAVRLKDKVDDAEVIAVTLGRQEAETTLRSALAMGADRGIFIKTDENPDGIITAKALKKAIDQDGKPDIIFTGKESIDSEGFQTMYRLAAGFGMPVVSNAVAFFLEREKVIVERELEAGAREVVEMAFPCVVGTGRGLNKPNYPTLPAIMKARKKEIKQIDLEQLNLEKNDSRIDIQELRPAVDKRKAEEVGGTPEEVAAEIVRILHEDAKVIP